MSWHIDSDDNAYNELGMVIAPVERTINGHTKFEIYLWFPQYDLYDDIAIVDTLSEARAFIKGYAAGYNDKIAELVNEEEAKSDSWSRAIIASWKRNIAGGTSAERSWQYSTI